MTNSPYQLFILRCKKSRFTYSAHTQQLTALFLVIFELLCLTSYPPFLNKQPKNVLSLQKKSCISAKYSSKLDILHSICIFFAPSTNESAQGASQEASITTKGGHNRRQAPVIY